MTLWEDHVHQFQLHGPSAAESAHSIVALFCGCLPRKIFSNVLAHQSILVPLFSCYNSILTKHSFLDTNADKTHVNAGNACRWFLNPDIKEAQPFYDRCYAHAFLFSIPSRMVHILVLSNNNWLPASRSVLSRYTYKFLMDRALILQFRLGCWNTGRLLK